MRPRVILYGRALLKVQNRRHLRKLGVTLAKQPLAKMLDLGAFRNTPLTIR